MSTITNVDAAGRAFLTKQEGEVLHSYQDSGGRWTIGVGHLMSTGAGGVSITHEQSQQLLTKDLARFEAAVARLVKVALTQNQFNALTSFAFNLGEDALAKSSLLRLLNAGNQERKAITAAFQMWCKVNGVPSASIMARRGREALLFFTP